MRIRRPQQVIAREMEEQLRLHTLSVEEELSWWTPTPEDDALFDAYEAGFIDSYDPDDDGWEDDFDCECPLCCMQDY